jgi:hypothetical protein
MKGPRELPGSSIEVAEQQAHIAALLLTRLGDHGQRICLARNPRDSEGHCRAPRLSSGRYVRRHRTDVSTATRRQDGVTSARSSSHSVSGLNAADAHSPRSARRDVGRTCKRRLRVSSWMGTGRRRPSLDPQDAGPVRGVQPLAAIDHKSLNV